eukprot:TRINITY_DN31924_c0_g1_i2.p1 TRINITY_DN31924_c0_g1~~TRINITY_DN31924_c0_g1_i2.p1  ORF type:complete len:938 (+),score=140.68 TRINITY_DN31924_c0_g1_i2:137-2815(+)
MAAPQGPYGQPPQYTQGGGYGPSPYGQAPPGHNDYGQPPPSFSQGHGGQGSAYYPDPGAGSPHSDPMASGHQHPYETGGSMASGYHGDPMASGIEGAYPEPEYEDYRQYTEQGKGSAGAAQRKQYKIDPDSGVAPRRCTDLVCIALAFLYFFFVLCTVLWTKSVAEEGEQYSDPMRLTNGMDYKARLCGESEGVKDKPYLFWCRLEQTATTWQDALTPLNPNSKTILNLAHPVCVENCPGKKMKMGIAGCKDCAPTQVECLMPEQGTGTLGKLQDVIVKGQASDHYEDYFLSFRQETKTLWTYDTELHSGRYCVPLDTAAKAEVMAGPLSLGERVHKSIGSFQDCWGVMFAAAATAVILSYFYVWIIGTFKNSAKYIVSISLIAVWILLLVAGFFFSFAVFIYFKDVPQLKDLPYDGYTSVNTFYERNEQHEANIISTVVGVTLLLLSCLPFGILMNLKHEFEHIHELIWAAWEGVGSMPSMLICPAIEALLKFLLMWIFGANFTYMMSCGHFDKYRIVIEGQLWSGLSSSFAYDYSMWFWVALYLYAWVWAIEICTSFGQFVVSFCGILWYFTKKVNGVKPDLVRPALDGIKDAFRYHLGSILLGAAGIWLFRFVRVFLWFENESLLTSKSACCPACKFLDGCVTSIGRCVDGCRGGERAIGKRRRDRKFLCFTVPDFMFQYNKNAYQDVVIRCQHYLQAMDKAERYINWYAPVQRYTGKCMLVTVCGVLWIGFAGAAVAYILMVHVSAFNDPASGSYIQDPAAVAILAFLLCASIAYGFTALIDHMADTLMYCFTFNKKFNKASSLQFVPHQIQDLVGHDGIQERTYGFFGRARPEMFLSTWVEGFTNIDRPGFNQHKHAASQAKMSQELSTMNSPTSAHGSPLSGRPTH